MPCYIFRGESSSLLPIIYTLGLACPSLPERKTWEFKQIMHASNLTHGYVDLTHQCSPVTTGVSSLDCTCESSRLIPSLEVVTTGTTAGLPFFSRLDSGSVFTQLLVHCSTLHHTPLFYSTLTSLWTTPFSTLYSFFFTGYLEGRW